MRRKTNLYHRLWYVRHNRKIECYVVIVLMVFILMLFLSLLKTFEGVHDRVSEYN